MKFPLLALCNNPEEPYHMSTTVGLFPIPFWVQSDVPEYQVLRPLLFKIFINDHSNIVTICNKLLVADDKYISTNKVHGQ